MVNQKTYLGDSVYAEIEHGMVKLTTNNDLGDSNTIYLEPDVMYSLIRFWNRVAGIDSEGEGREG